MKGYLSIINYYPDTNRDEGFGIGLVLISDEAEISLTKFSSERIKRINSAYGIKKSSLIDLAVENISLKKFDKKALDYSSVYENGNIRYSKPRIIDAPDLSKKFNELYLKFVADYYEESFDASTVQKREVSERLGRQLRKKLQSNSIINNRLNIGYDFKENSISKFLIGSSKIDYIGGNGTVYAGEILNLDLSEEAIQKNLFKTITLFEALEKSFTNRFSPSDCKMLVLEKQANDPDKADYMDKLSTWNRKANYGLVIKPELDDFQKIIKKDVEEKNIMRYDEWIKRNNLI